MMPKYKNGDIVHVALDYPKDAYTNVKVHGGFRHGDLRYSNETYRITGHVRPNGKQLRYAVETMNGKPIFGNYLQAQILLAK